jgi:hypothetical protein
LSLFGHMNIVRLATLLCSRLNLNQVKQKLALSHHLDYFVHQRKPFCRVVFFFISVLVGKDQQLEILGTKI